MTALGTPLKGTSVRVSSWKEIHAAPTLVPVLSGLVVPMLKTVLLVSISFIVNKE